VAAGLQTGDIVPNLLGLICGHLYFYCTEVASTMILPKTATEALSRIARGLPMEEIAEPAKPMCADDEEDDEDGGEDDDGEGSGDVAAAADAAGRALDDEAGAEAGGGADTED
jgi:hypothetical protein